LLEQLVVVVGVVVASVGEAVIAVDVLSLQPNQPGVSHVLVLVLDTKVDVLDISVVVVSSRHPHHPGVLHVSVLVLEDVVLVAVEVVVAVVWVPSSNFHK
jgi:hypothetical protein